MPKFVFIDLQVFVIKYSNPYLSISKFDRVNCTFDLIMFYIILFWMRKKFWKHREASFRDMFQCEVSVFEKGNGFIFYDTHYFLAWLESCEVDQLLK